MTVRPENTLGKKKEPLKEITRGSCESERKSTRKKKRSTATIENEKKKPPKKG